MGVLSRGGSLGEVDTGGYEYCQDWRGNNRGRRKEDESRKGIDEEISGGNIDAGPEFWDVTDQEVKAGRQMVFFVEPGNEAGISSSCQ